MSDYLSIEDARAILQLGENFDAKDVKRAYSRRLKVTRPEDDPAGFMALRKAFELMRKVAEYNQASDVLASQSTTSVTQELASTERPSNPPTPQPAASADPAPTAAERAGEYSVSNPEALSAPANVPERVEAPVDPLQARYREYSDRVFGILSRPESRADAEQWRAVIRPAREGPLDEWQVLDEAMRQIFIDYYNHRIDAQRNHPESDVLKNDLPITLTTGLFQGMDWHLATEADGPRYQQIDWLRGHMTAYDARDRLSSQQIALAQETSPFTTWQMIGGVLFVVVLLIRLAGWAENRDYSPSSYERPTVSNYDVLDSVRAGWVIDELSEPDLDTLKAAAVEQGLLYADPIGASPFDAEEQVVQARHLKAVLKEYARAAKMHPSNGDLVATLSEALRNPDLASKVRITRPKAFTQLRRDFLRAQVRVYETDPATSPRDTRRLLALRSMIEAYEAQLEQASSSDPTLIPDIPTISLGGDDDD